MDKPQKSSEPRLEQAWETFCAVRWGDEIRFGELFEKDPTIFSFKDGTGNNLLHIAVYRRRLEMLKFLLGYMANPAVNYVPLYEKNDLGDTPCFLAYRLCYEVRSRAKQELYKNSVDYLKKARRECLEKKRLASLEKREEMGKIMHAGRAVIGVYPGHEVALIKSCLARRL